MRFVVLAVVCLVAGWFGHDWYASHHGALPSVTVTVAPPSASAPKVTRPASVARKPQATAIPASHNGNACAFNNGVLDTCAGNGYVTPGITYYPPP